ncbi:sulfotransferase family protein [Nonomuraea fuscirosea]|uniref:sulfotransferase-like domain-containing protein n=1 Tax=Nonomuraea fuscirosea TaxID=1291556 RepID=UPI003405A947
MDTKPVILALWSLPRSRSTAFFRMMAQRGDFLAVHEPFSNLAEFGSAEVAGQRVRTPRALLSTLRSAAEERPVFFKDTTDERYPAVLDDRDFLCTGARHTFLIRHPRETIRSYHALNPEVRRHQIGVEALHEIFTAVGRLTGKVPVVIDSADLVTAPEALVRAYCARVSIPFDPRALTWEAGDRPEWRPTRRWHADVARSTGFRQASTVYDLDVDRDPVLSGHLRHHLPFYEELHRHRLRVCEEKP